jgi:hypothetical protein
MLAYGTLEERDLIASGVHGDGRLREDVGGGGDVGVCVDVDEEEVELVSVSLRKGQKGRLEVGAVLAGGRLCALILSGANGLQLRAR